MDNSLIKRQDAINALSTPHGILYPIRTIEELPSAESERTKVKWTKKIYLDDAVDAINDLPNCPNGYSDTYDKASIISVLEDLPPAESEQRWILTSERLPELNRNIIFTTSQGYVAEGEYDGMFDEHHAWCQYRWSATLWDDEVIAWIPLPEPWKGEENE